MCVNYGSEHCPGHSGPNDLFYGHSKISLSIMISAAKIKGMVAATDSMKIKNKQRSSESIGYLIGREADQHNSEREAPRKFYEVKLRSSAKRKTKKRF